MNDYKELIEALHIDEMFDAAKTIEHLVKERDQLHDQINRLVKRLDDETATVDRLEKENRAKEQYIAETIGKLVKERDAAIADIREALNRTEECLLCRWFDGTHGCRKSDKSCEKSKTDEWEWRGVQEVAK